MTTTPPDDQELEFECPLCGGTFAIETRWLGHAVECPHCGGEVTLAAEQPDGDAAAEGDFAGDEVVGDEPSEPPVENPLAGIADTPAADADPPTVEKRPSAPPAEPEPPAPAEPAAPLTPEERAALKRRVNAVLAIAGVIILVGTFALLAWLASSR